MSEELNYKINGDSSGLKKSLNEAFESTKKLEEGIKGIAEAIGLIYVAEKGFEFLKDTLKESFDAFKKNETAVHDLSRAVSMNGGLSKDLQELNEQREKLASTGTFSDVDIARAQIMSNQARLTSEQIQKLIPISADIASSLYSKKGMKLSLDQIQGDIDNFINTGKSKYLKLAGLSDNKNLTKSQREAQVEKLGGAKGIKGADLDAALHTTEGRIANLKNQWEKVLLLIGDGIAKSVNAILPYMKIFIEDIKIGIGHLKDLYHWVVNNKTVIEGVTGVITGGLIVAFTILKAEAIKTFAITQAGFITQAIEIAGVTTAIFFETLATDGLAAAFVAVGISATAAWAAATLGISLIIAALVGLYLHSYRIQAMFSGIGAFLKVWASDTLKTFEIFGKGAWKVIKSIGTLLKDAFHPENWKSDLNNIVNASKEVASNLSNAMSESRRNEDFAYKNAYKNSIAESMKKELEAKKKAGLKPNETTPAGGVGGGEIQTATSSEHVRENITITIQKLVEHLDIHTTYLENSGADITKFINDTLQNAVNSTSFSRH